MESTTKIGQHKFTMPASFKDTGKGTFTGYGNVTGIVDLGGDRVLPGAFKKDLEARGPIRPLLWSHDPQQPLGTVSLAEDSRGLRVMKGQLVLEVQRAAEIYALLKQPGAIGGMSIGYEIKTDQMVGGVREIMELSTWEVSLTCFPMNQESVIDSVKHGAANLDASIRRLSETIRQAKAGLTREADPTIAALEVEFRKLNNAAKRWGSDDPAVQAFAANLAQRLDEARASRSFATLLANMQDFNNELAKR